MNSISKEWQLIYDLREKRRHLKCEIQNLKQQVNRLRFALGIMFGVMTLVCMILVQE